jgi:hypothetical protein
MAAVSRRLVSGPVDELDNKAQLAKLIDEWYVPALSHASRGIEKRGELIDVILRHVPLKCPKEVLEAKRVRSG